MKIKKAMNIKVKTNTIKEPANWLSYIPSVADAAILILVHMMEFRDFVVNNATLIFVALARMQSKVCTLLAIPTITMPNCQW